MPIPRRTSRKSGSSGAALPHPRPADHGVQLLRVAVHEQLAAPLILCGALHFFAVLVELAQIDAPLLFLLAPTDPAPSPEASAEHQRAETDQAHHREEAGLQRPDPRGVHHHQGSDDPDQHRRKGDHQPGCCGARVPAAPAAGRPRSAPAERSAAVCAHPGRNRVWTCLTSGVLWLASGMGATAPPPAMVSRATSALSLADRRSGRESTHYRPGRLHGAAWVQPECLQGGLIRLDPDTEHPAVKANTGFPGCPRWRHRSSSRRNSPRPAAPASDRPRPNRGRGRRGPAAPGGHPC